MLESGDPETPMRSIGAGKPACVGRNDVTAERGNGYLSQSPNEIFASEKKDNPIEKATVYWPDGEQSNHIPPQATGSQLWEIKQETTQDK